MRACPYPWFRSRKFYPVLLYFTSVVSKKLRLPWKSWEILFCVTRRIPGFHPALQAGQKGNAWAPWVRETFCSIGRGGSWLKKFKMLGFIWCQLEENMESIDLLLVERRFSLLNYGDAVSISTTCCDVTKRRSNKIFNELPICTAYGLEMRPEVASQIWQLTRVYGLAAPNKSLRAFKLAKKAYIWSKFRFSASQCWAVCIASTCKSKIRWRVCRVHLCNFCWILTICMKGKTFDDFVWCITQQINTFPAEQGEIAQRVEVLDLDAGVCN